jgi:hypothetical protein
MKIPALTRLNAKIAISIAATGAIISIAFVQSPETGKTELTEKKKVMPPLKNVDVDYTLYTVSAAESSLLKYNSGSLIRIPSNAFVDKAGRPVEGKVDIKYREFHDPADFFMSGIPMTYDSAGTQFHFESAGMLEILAFKDDKPVFINPEKHIVVEMASEQTEDKYNIYQFDSLSGNWKFIYKDRALKMKNWNVKDLPIASTDKLPITASLLPPADLIKPQLLNPASYQFNLDVDQKEFPEISVYKEIQFEVKENTPDFAPAYASLIWNDVSLKKNENKGSYLMTLVKGAESHTFEVMPVFDKEAYDKAFQQYSGLLSKRRKEELDQKRKIDSVYSVMDQERNFQYSMAKENAKNEAASIETQEVVKRVFAISGFGIWNSDCPAILPQGEQFAAGYVDSTGKKLKFKTLYLVEKGRNAMFAITSYSRLYYNPAKKNILWAVTLDNKLAIFEEEKFKTLKKQNDSCTIQMKVIAEEIKHSYEVKKVLNF